VPDVRRAAPALLSALVLASCGADEEAERPDPAPSPPPPARSTVEPPGETRTGDSTAERGQETTTSQPPASGDCGVQGQYRVRVARGRVPCEEARSAVAGFSPDGPKVQQVSGYTCESGEADVRPLVFTCTLDGTEITATEP